MKLRLLGLVFAVVGMCGAQEMPRKNEVAFGLGGFTSTDRGGAQNLSLGPGMALSASYARLILGGRFAALYGEVEFAASPLREVTASSNTATHDVASLYITPGLRLKLWPTRRFAPFALVGGGYAEFEQSTTELSGAKNSASRELSRAAFEYGAGVDVHVWRFVSLRGEVRDFYSGAPAYNLPGIGGGQHNVLGGAGLVLGWH